MNPLTNARKFIFVRLEIDRKGNLSVCVCFSKPDSLSKNTFSTSRSLRRFVLLRLLLCHNEFLQLYIRRIYSVYGSLELILCNIKRPLIVFVLLHAFFRKGFCLFGTVNINLVGPFK